MAIKTFSSNTTLTASDVNTYLTNGGLVYVTESTATSGTTLSVNNCFTSTYDAYRIIISNLRTTAASTSLTMKLRASGTDSSATYAWGSAYMALFTSTALSFNGSQSTTAWDLVTAAETTATGLSVDVINPALAQFTQYSSIGVWGAKSTGGGTRMVSGLHCTATAYDGFTLTTGTAFANIKVAVYGYRQA